MATNKSSLWVIGLIATLALVCSFIAAVKVQPTGVTRAEVKAIVDNAVASIKMPSVNLDNIEQRLEAIENKLNKDDVWKDEAITLATEEWTKRNYKEIYEAIDELYGDIDVREDIVYVNVKDEEVTSFDTDDKDATVVQELKVKYEDVNGNEKKVYLTVTTNIEEGEIEDQEIEEA